MSFLMHFVILILLLVLLNSKLMINLFTFNKICFALVAETDFSQLLHHFDNIPNNSVPSYSRFIGSLDFFAFFFIYFPKFCNFRVQKLCSLFCCFCMPLFQVHWGCFSFYFELFLQFKLSLSNCHWKCIFHCRKAVFVRLSMLTQFAAGLKSTSWKHCIFFFFSV